MIAKAIPRTKSNNGKSRALPPVWQTPPLDADECCERIASLGQRIAGYIAYMSQANQPRAGSIEECGKAMASFYQSLVQVERQLARIHDEFRLV